MLEGDTYYQKQDANASNSSQSTCLYKKLPIICFLKEYFNQFLSYLKHTSSNDCATPSTDNGNCTLLIRQVGYLCDIGGTCCCQWL